MKARLRSLVAAFTLAVWAALSLIAPVSAVGTPRLYFPQASVQAQSGGDISMPLRVDPSGTKLDALDVVVNFPADKLSFVSIDKAGSYFGTMIPAAPTAQNGRLEFSVASLGGSASSDELIGSLLFSAKASSGSASVTLSGSQAAYAGTAVAVTAGSATVSFGGTATAQSGVKLSDIHISSVTVNSGVVRWHTDVPASSSVDYGTSTHYGFTASADGMVTDHRVQLGTLFAGATIVHFKVTSTTAGGQTRTSEDQTFSTHGYTIHIHVVDTAGKAVAGAKVSVAGTPAVTTDASGTAIVSDVAPGNQKVVIGAGKAQFVPVKTHSGAAATDIQQFTLTAQHTTAPWYAIALAIVLTILIVALLWRLRQKPAATTAQ